MAHQLPVVIRRDIRDKFDHADSAVQQKQKSLKDVIGYAVDCEVDWAMLWTECASHFEDKSAFVPHITSAITAFCDDLTTKLEDEDSPWTEQLLEKIEQTQAVKLIVQIVRNREAYVRFSDERGFILGVPCKPSFSPTSRTKLLQELDSIFTLTPNTTFGIGGVEHEVDDWAAVSSASASIEADEKRGAMTPTHSAFSFASPSIVPARPSPLPNLASLARPDSLFTRSTPHIMQMRVEGRQNIVIQATHEPSLKLVYEYFNKWVTHDPKDVRKIPLLRHNLIPSCLGPGTYLDTLIIEPFSQVSGRGDRRINPSIFQCFIESVLNYECVDSGSGGGDRVFWEFRRHTPFT